MVEIEGCWFGGPRGKLGLSRLVRVGLGLGEVGSQREVGFSKGL